MTDSEREGLLSGLEQRQALRDQALKAKAARPAQEEDADMKEWLDGMAVLAGGGSYQEERKAFYEQQREKGLTPEQMKKKYLQDRQDDKWLEDMHVLSSGSYEERRDLYRERG